MGKKNGFDISWYMNKKQLFFFLIRRFLMSRPYMNMPYHHWRCLPAQVKMLNLNDAAQKFYLFVQHKGSQEFVEYME